MRRCLCNAGDTKNSCVVSMMEVANRKNIFVQIMADSATLKEVANRKNNFVQIMVDSATLKADSGKAADTKNSNSSLQLS